MAEPLTLAQVDEILEQDPAYLRELVKALRAETARLHYLTDAVMSDNMALRATLREHRAEMGVRTERTRDEFTKLRTTLLAAYDYLLAIEGMGRLCERIEKTLRETGGFAEEAGRA